MLAVWLKHACTRDTGARARPGQAASGQCHAGWGVAQLFVLRTRHLTQALPATTLLKRRQPLTVKDIN